ncbi:MAG: biopolymer transporter ExbD [Hyphomicrobiales bacterium]|nr:MAG: biopolymer transporter ExbD [Hyphomicrobiales bacterium]
MRQWPTKKERHARIEIIPMIDVMMFLLVFFVLISLNVLPALGLRIKPPTSANVEKVVERQRLTVGIDREGKTTLDGQPIDISDIAEKIRSMSTGDKVLSVIIAGDEAAALQHLIDVMDALKLAGVASTQIITRPK